MELQTFNANRSLVLLNKLRSRCSCFALYDNLRDLETGDLTPDMIEAVLPVSIAGVKHYLVFGNRLPNSYKAHVWAFADYKRVRNALCRDRDSYEVAQTFSTVEHDSVAIIGLR